MLSLSYRISLALDKQMQAVKPSLSQRQIEFIRRRNFVYYALLSEDEDRAYHNTVTFVHFIKKNEAYFRKCKNPLLPLVRNKHGATR